MGARFEALNEGVLAAALKSTEYFFAISISQKVRCPFMANLWIRSGCDMKVGESAETYQVEAHFKALIMAILVALSRILEIFFHFMFHCRAVLYFYVTFGSIRIQAVNGIKQSKTLTHNLYKRGCKKEKSTRNALLY